MADASSELAAHVAAANNYLSQVDTAPTRKAAVNLAIKAAESFMAAMKEAPNKKEQLELKKQCKEAMDIAQDIKTCKEWIPKQPLIDLSDTQPTESLSSTSQELETQASATSDLSVGTTLVHRPKNREAEPESSKTENVSHSSGAVQRPFKRPSSSNVPSSASKALPIKQLPEPVSTRALSKRENIILWQASVVNGFKFPPWHREPYFGDFPLENQELFTDSSELKLSPYQQQLFAGWIRANDALPPPSWALDTLTNSVNKTEQHPVDLVQDAATDCSVVASLCAIVARDIRGHNQMLAKMMVPNEPLTGEPSFKPNGKYIFRLNMNGCWRKVVIDDRLPVSNSHRLLHVIDRNNPGSIWPALIEKAYLKARGGYDFPGSNSCNDLWTLTGWIPEQIYLQEADTVPDQLWNRVYMGFLYGDVLVTAGTGKMTARQERDLGLEGQHSYAILNMKETEEDRYFLVKNPWAEGKGWRGPRPSLPDAQEGPNHEQEHPTTFWIPLHDVIRHFESLYLNWNPGLFAYRQDIHFEWEIEYQHKSNRCVFRNPQFSVSVRKTDEVWLLLSRHIRDSSSPKVKQEEVNDDSDANVVETQSYTPNEPLPGYMSVYVCNGNGERIYMKESHIECTPEVNTPQALLRWRAQANSDYTIIVEQDELPESTYSFSLSAFSTSAVSIEPVNSRYKCPNLVEGEWTKQTAGGTVDLPTYFYNPQYTLEVKKTSSVAILLRSFKHSHPMHVTLAMGHGKRLFRLQTRDILADSGGYRDEAVFAEMHDLQPGVYTIICSLFEAGKTGGFILRVDSTDEIVLKQVPREGAGLMPYYGLEPACFGPQIQRLAAPIQLHRLAKFNVVAQFLRARSPQSYDLGLQARSPLLLSVEMGRGPEKRVVVSSEDGQHSDSLTIRSGSFDLNPNDQNGRNLWLVLDRLSKPSGPVEELYEVKVWTDVPHACRIGTWCEWDD